MVTQWFRRLILPLCVATLALAGGMAARGAAALPLAYTLIGSAGAVVRVVTEAGVCPTLEVNGQPLAMSVRAAPSDAFPVLVCDAALPEDAADVRFDGRALPLPVRQPAHIAIVGDTGCRVKGTHLQACNDPLQWPWAQLAASAAAGKSELVIHVGDYVYRETACPDGNDGCAGSPYGDNWETWYIDMLAPARSLLEAAPWVVMRGNHEDCARMGNGYFLLMDPRPLPASCPDYTDVYAVDDMEPQLLIMDNATVDDYNIDPDQLAVYGPQLAAINAAARERAWFLLHDPMYVFGHAGEENGKEKLFIDQLTLQQASDNRFSPGIELFLSGHIHLLEVLSFGPERPAQLVVGHSGTQLDPPISTSLAGLEIAGMPVAYGLADASFGYVTAHWATDGWDFVPRDVTGVPTDRCSLRGRELLCGSAAAAARVPAVLPATGSSATGMRWAMVLLAVLLLLGLASAINRRQRPPAGNPPVR